MSADQLQTNAEQAAQDLIETLGPQQTFARLGWQVEPDYKPAEHCFDHWSGMNPEPLSAPQIADCELHASDLSRLYASYGTDAPPIIFKSDYYWAALDDYHLAYPKLVEAWKAAGGREDDASYLKHPICAEPLQTGWTGSDFFWDGSESPKCRAHKIEALEGE